jgi:hypothetical protein
MPTGRIANENTNGYCELIEAVAIWLTVTSLWDSIRANESAGGAVQILPFINPRTGTPSWRVTGTRRNGERIRENFASAQEARYRHKEFEPRHPGGDGVLQLAEIRSHCAAVSPGSLARAFAHVFIP